MKFYVILNKKGKLADEEPTLYKSELHAKDGLYDEETVGKVEVTIITKKEKK